MTPGIFLAFVIAIGVAAAAGFAALLEWDRWVARRHARKRGGFLDRPRVGHDERRRDG